MADLPNRATHRWTGYDYAQRGAYYLTICTQDRLHLFGRIVDGVLQPSPIGTLAQQFWDAIPEHMPHVDIGEFVVMPNHVHGIVIIRERLVRAGNSRGDVGADHDRPGTIPDDDAMQRPDIMPDNDAPQRPDAMPEPDATTQTGMETVTDGNTANAPTAQRRADHDRPLRPPANADARPRTPMPIVPVDSLGRIVRAYSRADHDRPLRPPANADARPRTPMPIVPVDSLGRIVRAYRSAVTRMAYRDGLLPHGTPVFTLSLSKGGNAIIGTA